MYFSNEKGISSNKLELDKKLKKHMELVVSNATEEACKRIILKMSE